MFKGISKRWLINTFGVILAIIVLLVVSLSIAVHSLCYSTVDGALTNHAQELSSIFPDHTSESTDTFLLSATSYATDFEHKDEMEVQIVNSAGRVVTTSSEAVCSGSPVLLQDASTPEIMMHKSNRDRYFFI